MERVPRWFLFVLVGMGNLIPATKTVAQGGHGPVFGLATPTLPQGGWNVDVTAMTLEAGGRAATIRGTVRYGWTEDIQLNFSAPLSLERIARPPNTRVGTMMGGMGDLELMALWRVHKQYPGVGSRFETTLVLGGLYATTDQRRGLDTAPGFLLGAVTGYASRTVYAWVGGGFQRYLKISGDRLGHLGFVSAVAAWRPPVFQGDYPKPDWRIFLESLIEFAGRDLDDGADVRASGGEKVFLGPTFLGLYRAFGLGMGALLPAYQDVNGDQPEEGIRLTLNLSYWF